MILNAEKLSTWETCPRRYQWQNRYQALRVSPLRALYMALDAGLRAESNPERAAENELLALAASPGLDVLGPNVYPIAMHYAKLAGILSVALRSASDAPWCPWPDGKMVLNGYPTHEWRSACYDAGDGHPRRIVLVDRWSDDREAQELRGWRTLGEACALRKPIVVTAVTIGASHEKRRVSPWTRCYQHPRNRQFRFKRTTSAEDFGANWLKLWREDLEIPTADWLTRMRKDGCMEDLVHTVSVPVPARRDDYARQIMRIADEMGGMNPPPGRAPEHPPMRLAGCYTFNPCPFIVVCHGASPHRPELYGFLPILGQSASVL